MNYLVHPSRCLALCPQRISRHTPQRRCKRRSYQIAAQDLLTGNLLIVGFQGESEPVAWDLSFGKDVDSENPQCGLLIYDRRDPKLCQKLVDGLERHDLLICCEVSMVATGNGKQPVAHSGLVQCIV